MKNTSWHTETIVILDYTDPNPGLDALCSGCPEPMLPVGNKPLIQHQLEWLCDAGFANIHIALPKHQTGEWVSMLKSFRFGSKISHGFYNDSCQFEQCRKIFLSNYSGALWVSGHQLCRVRLPQHLKHSSLFIRSGNYVPITYLTKRDLFLLMPQLCRLEHLTWMNLICEVLKDIGLTMLQGFACSLRTPWEYQSLVRTVLAMQTPLRMRQKGQDPQIIEATKPHLGSGAQIEKPTILGEHVAIGADARVENCVLGDQVFVDEQASLKHCVVAPNTYIGRDVHLEDKFIRNGFIFDFRTNTGRYVMDKHFCAAKEDASHPLVALISRFLLRGRQIA